MDPWLGVAPFELCVSVRLRRDDHGGTPVIAATTAADHAQPRRNHAVTTHGCTIGNASPRGGTR